MRFIDADKLIEKITQNCPFKIDTNYESVWGIPIIEAIPIDKPFLKMRYGDYVIYNKQWLVNHLQTEWNILQGKEYPPAIPIEWIRAKVKQHYNEESYQTAGAFQWIIDMWYEEKEDWEKENEKS